MISIYITVYISKYVQQCPSLDVVSQLYTPCDRLRGGKAKCTAWRSIVLYQWEILTETKGQRRRNWSFRNAWNFSARTAVKFTCIFHSRVVSSLRARDAEVSQNAVFTVVFTVSCAITVTASRGLARFMKAMITRRRGSAGKFSNFSPDKPYARAMIKWDSLCNAADGRSERHADNLSAFLADDFTRNGRLFFSFR